MADKHPDVSSLSAAARWRGVLLFCALTLTVTGCVTHPAKNAPAAATVQSGPASMVEKTKSATRPVAGTRSREIKPTPRDSEEYIQRHLAAMMQPLGRDFHSGNRARLLVDGPATFAAMLDAIRKAKRSILLESYIIENADISQQLAALLVEKRADGIEVAVMYDAVGSIGTDAAFFESLGSNGVMVCAFNPVNPFHRFGYWGINHRDHRKILAVDGITGFTGGINISSAYSSGSIGRQRQRQRVSSTEKGWRDTQIEIHGPAAGALDQLVRDTWQEQGCKGDLQSAGIITAAVNSTAGQELIGVVPATPNDDFNRIYTLLLTTIRSAQQSIYLTMAYFAPGEDLLEALCDAAQRGVEVKLILPSKSDFAPVLHAGRSYYSRLMDAGVQIYELQDSVLHAKTAVIDGVVSTVGSSNMDWRSFTSNNEVNAVVISRDFGDVMIETFKQDLSVSQAITPEAWANRPLLQRAKESMARVLEFLW